MNMPGFTAESSLTSARPYRSVSWGPATNRDRVFLQFCFCECMLVRTCIWLPPYEIPFCYYRQRCFPRGNCPPGYCHSQG